MAEGSGSPRPLRLATRAVRAGEPAAAGRAPTPGALGPHGERAHVPPIYQTSNFDYPTAADADAAAAGAAHLYSRHGNPTVEALERALADLDGGERAVAFGSGMAAIAASVFGLARGGELVVSEGIYGGSTALVSALAPMAGITARFVPAWETAAVASAIGPSTRAVLVETLTNPLLRVTDLAALARLTRDRGVSLIVDSTFTTPALVRPLEHGATVVVHSLSKYVGGHADLLGGVVIGAAEALAPVVQQRVLTGGVLDPFAAWLALRGLRTLALRLERQVANAARLADVLAALPSVRRVWYPGRADHPDHALARTLLAAPGAMVSFELADGAAARRCYDRVRVIGRAASLGDVTSLLTHPASFSHKDVPAPERARLGISEGLLRLSVGIEDVADLEADLSEALSG